MKLLTPSGVAGITVVRADARERMCLERALSALNRDTIHLSAGGSPRRALLHLDGVVVDDVIVVDRGDAGIEMHLHGGRAVLDTLHRHFDLHVVDERDAARCLLLEAHSVQQLELAIEQIAFEFGAACAAIVRLPIPQMQEEVGRVIERSRIAMAMAAPARVCLVGGQNAGKSTLFNQLLLRERVLTGPMPGLTRDPVVEATTLDGYPYELIDTAGVGATTSTIEQMAVAAGRERHERSLLVLVVDSSLPPSAVDLDIAPRAALVVASKCDLPACRWPEAIRPHLGISCVTQNSSDIRAAVGSMLRKQRQLPPAGPVGGVAALEETQLQHLLALVMESACIKLPSSVAREPGIA